jgi:localization factor PodJL
MKLGVPWTSKGKKTVRPAPSDEAETTSVRERLDRLTHQFERLSRITAGDARSTGSDADAAAEQRSTSEEEIVNSRRRLDQRLEEIRAARATRREEDATFSDEQSPRRSPLRPVYSDADLDQTLAEITVRQRALEDASRLADRARPEPRQPAIVPSQDLSGLGEQLRKITTQIESLQIGPPPRPCALEEAMPALREELSRIGRSLAEAVPRRAIEAIQAEVRGLSQRLDQSRHSGIDAAALANIEQGLAEVREALGSLKPAESLVEFHAAVQGLSRKIDDLAASRQDPVVLQQLESAITGLRSIVAHVASDDTLARLTEEVRGIAARLERAGAVPATPDALLNLERRLDTIAEAVERSITQGASMPAKLELSVRELADRIEQLQVSRSDTVAFGQLEERIARLVEKLDASGARFSHLAAIERGLGDVLVHLEEQRRGGALRPSDSDKAVELLKNGLDKLNGTLNRVVDRLASIEGGIGSDRGSPPTPNVAPAAPPRPASVGTSSAPPAERLTTPPYRPSMRERLPIDPTLPPDHPLEPGAAGGRPQSPADRIAAPEAALGPAGPSVPPDSLGKSNFIAAARRAAQAAQQWSTPEAATASSDARQKSSLRGRLTGRIRSMLVGAGVIVFALGAATVATTLIKPDTARMSDSQTAVRTPAIQSAPKSTARVAAEPTVAGATPQSGTASAGDAKPSATAAPPVDPTAHSVADETPLQEPIAEPNQTDFTGSIPTETGTPSEPALPPLPPKRQGGDGSSDESGSRLVTAAKAGDPAAAYELAVRHIDGRGVRQSYEEAAKWLTRASKHGLAPAQFRLGSLFEKGLGVKKSLSEARRLYAASAAKGNAKAMHNLAVLNVEGVDGKPDYGAAIEWFRKAGRHGIADSQYNLGVLYARGVGVEQNLAESYKWFALAADQGDKQAARKRDELAKQIDADSLMAARLALKTWVYEREPAEATTVRAPAGGWDQEAAPTSAKRHPRTGAPLKLGPG